MSNKESHESNTRKGNLFSNLKDGLPAGLLQNIIAKAYPLVLLTMLAINTYLIKKVKKIGWWFVWYLLIGAAFGWTWNLVTVHYDPTMPGWLYHPWAILGPEFGGIVIEDYIFYVLCGALFYLFRDLIPDFGVSKEKNKMKVIIAQLVIIMLTTFIWDKGGWYISMWFALPGTIMLWSARETLNLGRYFIVGMFVFLLGSHWDILVSTVIPSIPGYAWASQWVYLSFDANGVAHHSSIWLSYSEHKWAWVGNTPIEILYWFNISGWWFIYGLAQFTEKYIKRS